MKTHLIAAFMILSTSIASAQVTVYGVLDQSIRSTSLDNGVKTTATVSGSFYTSRLGFKGTEDLGHGLTASFVLEGRIDTNNGSTDTNNFFNRESSVSLSSNALGTVTMGRTDTSDTEGIDTLAGFRNFGNFALTRGAEYSGDRANTIRYATPSIMGATFKIGRSHVDGTTAETDSASVIYRGNGFAVGAGIDKTGTDEYTAVGGNINVGTATVGAMYGKRDATIDVTVSVLSIKVPLTHGLSAHGVYKTNQAENSVKITTTALGLTHELSKRTFLQAVYQDTNAGSTAGNFFQLGLVHRF